MRIVQFTPGISLADGVSRGVLLTARLLQRLGLRNIIVSRHIDTAFSDVVTPIAGYRPEPDDLLVVHHCIGHEDHDHIMSLDIPKVLAYHNITPAFYFGGTPHLYQACTTGRTQLRELVVGTIAHYADSAYNRDELLAIGAHAPTVLPLLISIDDLEQWWQAPSIQQPQATSEPEPVLLFVGRIVPNKFQHRLIELCAHLRHYGKPFRLVLIGSVSDPVYYARLKRMAIALGLRSHVEFPGKISDAELATHYTRASAFVSLSNHEGFCIPLVESIVAGVPVLAYRAGGIETAIGDTGLLMHKGLDAIAEAVIALTEQPRLRAEILDAQTRHVQAFRDSALTERLEQFLRTLSVPLFTPLPSPTYASHLR